MKKKIVLILSFLFLLIVPSFVLADGGFWKGFVFITNGTGNNLSASPGTVVDMYVNGVWKNNYSTSAKSDLTNVGSNYYIIGTQANDGDSVTFRIWGSGTDNQTAQSYGAGIHPTDSPTSWFNLTFTALANSAACNNSHACTGGYCCNGGTQVDMASTYSGTSGTCQATACSAGGGSSSGGGSGGGGSSGGGGGGAAAVSETSTVSGSVVSGGTATFPYTKAADTGISSIEVTTSGVVTNPQITVKETTLGSGQTAAISSASGGVYQYLTITKTNIKDTDIQSAKVKFQVLKSWAVTNDIDPMTIALTRFVSNAWDKQPTTFLKEDNDYYYYEATVPGFSLFAISGDKRPEKLTSFQIIDIIRDFYAGKPTYNAFGIIDLIRKFYA